MARMTKEYKTINLMKIFIHYKRNDDQKSLMIRVIHSISFRIQLNICNLFIMKYIKQ